MYRMDLEERLRIKNTFEQSRSYTLPQLLWFSNTNQQQTQEPTWKSNTNLSSKRVCTEATKKKLRESMLLKQPTYTHCSKKLYCARCHKFYEESNIDQFTRLSKVGSHLLCKDCGTRIRLYARGRSNRYKKSEAKRI
jgi:Pyruvate/2-oxoacid:ferredoxin oxidoreductase delta subunit